jgi:hypothetical protein
MKHAATVFQPRGDSSEPWRVGRSNSSRFDYWRNLAVATVGIFMLASALPTLTYWVVLAGSDVFAPSALVDMSYEQKANAVATLMQLAIALWLTFGARQVSAWLFRPGQPSTAGNGDWSSRLTLQRQTPIGRAFAAPSRMARWRASSASSCCTGTGRECR